jgi:hypothetical protein
MRRIRPLDRFTLVLSGRNDWVAKLTTTIMSARDRAAKTASSADARD